MPCKRRQQGCSEENNKDRVPIHVALMSLYNEIGRDKIRKLPL